MLITDSPELMNLQEDQAPSTESLIAPSQPRIIWLKWTPIFETVQRGARPKKVPSFLHSQNDWMDIMLIYHLLAEHPFATKFDQTCKALTASCSHLHDTDGKLVYPVKGFGEKAVKVFWRADGVCEWIY